MIIKLSGDEPRLYYYYSISRETVIIASVFSYAYTVLKKDLNFCRIICDFSFPVEHELSLIEESYGKKFWQVDYSQEIDYKTVKQKYDNFVVKAALK